MATAEPVINAWYRDPETEESFVVVGVNEDTETVELQDLGGDVEELSFDVWYDTGFESIDPPDDDWDVEGSDDAEEEEEEDEDESLDDDDWDEENDGTDDDWDDDWGRDDKG